MNVDDKDSQFVQYMRSFVPYIRFAFMKQIFFVNEVKSVGILTDKEENEVFAYKVNPSMPISSNVLPRKRTAIVFKKCIGNGVILDNGTQFVGSANEKVVFVASEPLKNLEKHEFSVKLDHVEADGSLWIGVAPNPAEGKFGGGVVYHFGKVDGKSAGPLEGMGQIYKDGHFSPVFYNVLLDGSSPKGSVLKVCMDLQGCTLTIYRDGEEVGQCLEMELRQDNVPFISMLGRSSCVKASICHIVA